MPIVPLITAGASLIGSLFGNRRARRNTEATIQANREAADLAWSREVEMWNMQNKYNDPSQQMARLKSAGLNPNLVYGSSSVVGNTASGMPSYQAPNLDYSGYESLIPNSQQIGDALGAYVDSRQKNMEHNLMREKLKIEGQRALNEGLKNHLLLVEKESKEFELGQKKEVAPYQVEYQKKVNDKMEREINSMLLSDRLKDQEYDLKKGEFDLQALDYEAKKEGIKNIKVERMSKYQQYRYDKVKSDLIEDGINVNDPAVVRILMSHKDKIQNAVKGSATYQWLVDKIRVALGKSKIYTK